MNYPVLLWYPNISTKTPTMNHSIQEIPRPFHLVFHEGKFVEIQEGGDLPEGVANPDEYPLPIVTWLPTHGLLKDGWWGGFAGTKNPHALLLKKFNNRSEAERWLREEYPKDEAQA